MNNKKQRLQFQLSDPFQPAFDVLADNPDELDAKRITKEKVLQGERQDAMHAAGAGSVASSYSRGGANPQDGYPATVDSGSYNPALKRGLAATTTKTSVRINSVNRLVDANSTVSDFSVFLTPQIQKAIAFQVQSVAMFNDFPNISAALGNNSVTARVQGQGADQTLLIPDGAYDVGGSGTLEAALLVLLQTLTGITANSVTAVVYQPAQMSIGVTMTAGNTITIRAPVAGTATTTAGPAIGIRIADGDYIIPQADARPVKYPVPQVFPSQVQLGGPPFLAIGSPQLRRPGSIDSKPGGSNNCFHHLLVNAPKKGAITYQVDGDNSELAAITFPGPQGFQIIHLSVSDPQTGAKIALVADWEIIIHFYIAP